MTWAAYVDESRKAGIYVLSAAVFDVEDASSVRETVLALAPRPGLRFHWKEQEQQKDREKAAGTVAGLGALQIAVVGTPVGRREERARRLCLGELLFRLDGLGVSQVWMEARQRALNGRDMAAVRAFRARHLIGHDIRVDHAYPSKEPLLWVPDIVAGAVSAAEVGEERNYRDLLAEVLTVYRIALH